MAQNLAKKQVAYPASTLIFKEDFAEDDGLGYLFFEKKKYFRMKLVGVITQYVQQNSYTSFLINDSFGSVEVRLFESITTSFDVGDVVLIIGRPRKWNDTIYLNASIIKKINPLWAKYHVLSLSHIYVEENITLENEIHPVDTILSLIKTLDKGDGALFDDVIKKSHIKDCESFIENLINSGEIFEYKPGRLKIL